MISQGKNGLKLEIISYGKQFFVVMIPLLLNLLMCYLVFPVNHNLAGRIYESSSFGVELLGQSRMYSSFGSGYPFLSLYLHNPFLYQVLYLLICGYFSGLCGAAVMAFSFWFSRSKLVLFIPLYLVVIVSSKLDGMYLNLAINGADVRYFDLYIPDYLASFTSIDCSWLYMVVLCVLLNLFIVLSYKRICRREADELVR